MKKFILIFTMVGFFAVNACAFLYEVKVLTKEEIKVLKDDQLLDKFIEAKIEVEASKTFHGKAGFNPKEYDKFKELLGYVVKLNQEMKAREIEVPPVDEWLK